VRIAPAELLLVCQQIDKLMDDGFGWEQACTFKVPGLGAMRELTARGFLSYAGEVTHHLWPLLCEKAPAELPPDETVDLLEAFAVLESIIAEDRNFTASRRHKPRSLRDAHRNRCLIPLAMKSRKQIKRAPAAKKPAKKAPVRRARAL
jgi:hypothetical protein